MHYATNGPKAQHLLSGPRLPFTGAYFGSIALTIYFSVGVSAHLRLQRQSLPPSPLPVRKILAPILPSTNLGTHAAPARANQTKRRVVSSPRFSPPKVFPNGTDCCASA